jgi:methoxymalonate biosynthesis acyl carrier protein
VTASTGHTTTDIARSLVAFLEDRTKRTWDTDTDLFRSGAVSSLFAMELVVHLEATFGIAITGPDLVMDNFRTVDVMTALVERLLATKA